MYFGARLIEQSVILPQKLSPKWKTSLKKTKTGASPTKKTL